MMMPLLWWWRRTYSREAKRFVCWIVSGEWKGTWRRKEGTTMRRAVLCAPLCNCRHSLRADDEVGLVEAALEHMRLHHPAAPVEEERVREIVSTRSYAIEYVAV
jgi:predicted small metal-binding protein